MEVLAQTERAVNGKEKDPNNRRRAERFGVKTGDRKVRRALFAAGGISRLQIPRLTVAFIDIGRGFRRVAPVLPRLLFLVLCRDAAGTVDEAAGSDRGARTAVRHAGRHPGASGGGHLAGTDQEQ